MSCQSGSHCSSCSHLKPDTASRNTATVRSRHRVLAGTSAAAARPRALALADAPAVRFRFPAIPYGERERETHRFRAHKSGGVASVDQQPGRAELLPVAHVAGVDLVQVVLDRGP